MERILITGDTHGHIDEIVRFMDNVKFDAVIHLGDYARDAATLAKAYKDTHFYTVYGNNDFLGNVGDTKKVITVDGKKIFLCHGHNLGAGSNLLKMSLAAREVGAEIAIHGHTHTTEDLMVNSVRIFSPGSPTYPRNSRRAVGILEAEDGIIRLAHYYFE